MIIISFLIIYNITLNSRVSIISATTSSEPISDQPSLNDLVIALPMIINYDSDFESYSLPGDGSPGNPYRIENYNITTSGGSCLVFGGYTTKHFIIQNCFLKTDSDYSIIIGKDENLDEGSIVVKGVEVEVAGSGGLKLNGSIEADFYENYIVSVDAGIDIRDSDFTYVKGNTIHANTAIRLTNTLGVSLINNVCNDNTEVGIQLTNSNDTVITGNNCSNNSDTGIIAQDSLNLTITHNYLIDNFFGMRITGSSGSLITNNQFETNTAYGLSMHLSVGLNKIYHNAFFDNNLGGSGIQALDDAGDQWYHELLLSGNYWDDWSPAVSSSYSIDGSAGSADLYPLGDVPEISEYSIGYLAYILVIVFLTIPIIGYIKRRR